MLQYKILCITHQHTPEDPARTFPPSKLFAEKSGGRVSTMTGTKPPTPPIGWKRYCMP